MKRWPAGTARSLLTSCLEWPSSPPSLTTTPPWVELPCCPAASRPPVPFLQPWSLTGELQTHMFTHGGCRRQNQFLSFFLQLPAPSKCEKCVLHLKVQWVNFLFWLKINVLLNVMKKLCVFVSNHRDSSSLVAQTRGKTQCH